MSLIILIIFIILIIGQTVPHYFHYINYRTNFLSYRTTYLHYKLSLIILITGQSNHIILITGQSNYIIIITGQTTSLPPIKTGSAPSHHSAEREKLSWRSEQVDKSIGWGGGKKRVLKK